MTTTPPRSKPHDSNKLPTKTSKTWKARCFWIGCGVGLVAATFYSYQRAVQWMGEGNAIDVSFYDEDSYGGGTRREATNSAVGTDTVTNATTSGRRSKSRSAEPEGEEVIGENQRMRSAPATGQVLPQQEQENHNLTVNNTLVEAHSDNAITRTDQSLPTTLPTPAVTASVDEDKNHTSLSSQPLVHYITDNTTCRECYNTFFRAEKGMLKTCLSLMAFIMKKEQLPFANATQTHMAHKWNCSTNVCDPTTCHEKQQKFWRYDSAAPPVEKATRHYLRSIPQKYRLPSHLFLPHDANTSEQALNDFFGNPANVYPERRYLFDYNPSIIQLPKSSNHKHLKLPPTEAVYLASYRISTQQGCFPTETTRRMIGGDWETRPKEMNYLGLALLRRDLSIIDETIVTPTRQFFAGIWEDFRLFLLNDQIYLTSFCHLVPLWIHVEDGGDGGDGTDKVPLADELPKQQYIAERAILPNATQATIVSNMHVILGKKVTRCAWKRGERIQAKNINYFIDPSNNRIMAESQVFNPHRLHRLEMGGLPNSKHDIVTEESPHPNPSFSNRGEVDLPKQINDWGYPFAMDRGGACCVSLEDPYHATDSASKNNIQTLLMGISHVKTKKSKPFIYLSRFYAFDPNPPFRTVVMSGFFCLPHSFGTTTEKARAYKDNGATAIPSFPNFYEFEFADTKYDCPAIHFVSGIAEKIEDPTKVIIAYGASDCASWFIEVSKKQIWDILHSGLNESEIAQ